MHGIESVIVCGGGLAGVAFAASLVHCCQQASIKTPQITIFEKCSSKESKLHSREYTISLRDTDTLSFLGLSKEAEKYLSPSREFYVATYDWNNRYKKYISVPSNTPGSETIRLKMAHLYNVLYESLSPDLVKVVWNSEVSQIREVGGKVNITLLDGAEMSADFVVVADGHSSALRSQLFQDKPMNFTSAVGISGIAQTMDFPEEVNHSHGMTLGRDSLLWMSQEDKDHAIWAIMFKSDNTLQGPMMNRDTSKDSEENRKLRTSLRDLVLSRFGSSYPVLRSLVPLTPLSKIRVLNGYDKMPHECSKKYSRIVLIGDANHPVTPLSGIGASMALTDAQKLAISLTSVEHKDLSSAVRHFEADMVKRASAVVKQGRFTIRMLLSSNLFWVWTKYSMFTVIGAITNFYGTIKWAVAILGVLLLYHFFIK